MALSRKQLRDVQLWLDDAEHASTETAKKVDMLVRFLAGHEEELPVELATALADVHARAAETEQIIVNELRPTWAEFEGEKR